MNLVVLADTILYTASHLGIICCILSLNVFVMLDGMFTLQTNANYKTKSKFPTLAVHSEDKANGTIN